MVIKLSIKFSQFSIFKEKKQGSTDQNHIQMLPQAVPNVKCIPVSKKYAFYARCSVCSLGCVFRKSHGTYDIEWLVN